MGLNGKRDVHGDKAIKPHRVVEQGSYLIIHRNATHG